MISLFQIAEAVHSQLPESDAMVNGIAINTREDCTGKLFVALKGENFDAHDFVENAKAAGADALMVEKAVDSDLPTLRVESTHAALLQMSAWWRRQFAIPVIGVTGSAGKTTVKEMLSSIFNELGQGISTLGNLNNEIGVPLTLMRLNSAHRYAIVEMGMNKAGEISRLTECGMPTVALVNNAGEAHLEGLGSVEAVAQAKGEIYQGLTEDGIAVINNDDQYADYWKSLNRDRQIRTFGFSQTSDVRASYDVRNGRTVMQVRTDDEEFEITLSAEGEHNVMNALAAIAAALSANVSVEQVIRGLESFSPVKGRLVVEHIGETRVIDDTYNANPTSMRAGIAVAARHKPCTLLLGDMAELGSAAEAAHADIGRYAAQMQVDAVYACGEYASSVVRAFSERSSSQVSVRAFETQEELIAELAGLLKANNYQGSYFVKGSRSARMEHVVTHLKQHINEVVGSSEGRVNAS